MAFRLANSADPNEMSHYAASHLVFTGGCFYLIYVPIGLNGFFSAISNAYISTFEPAHKTWVLIPYVEKYRKACVKRPLSKRPKIGFQDQLSLNAGQKYCRMGTFCNTFDYH